MDKAEKANQSFRHVIDNNLFIIKYICRYTPGYLVISILFSIFAATVTFFEHTYCIKYLVDIIQFGKPFRNAVIYIVTMAIIVTFKLITNAYLDLVIKEKAQPKLHRLIRMDVYKKAVGMDLACYDDPSFYNEFVWATGEIATRVDSTMSCITRFFDSITWVVTSGALMLMLDKIGLIFVLFSFIMTSLTSMVLNRLKYRMDVELKPKQRKLNYIHRVFYLTDYAKEIRMNPIDEKLKNEYVSTNKEIKDVIEKHTKKQVLVEFLNEYVFNSLILDGFYTLYVFFIAAIKKAISYGSGIALLNSAGSVKRCLRDIALLIPEFQQNSFYIERIRTFLDYEQKVVSAKEPIEVPQTPKVLELKNVTFKYHEDREPVLKNISLKINPCEKIAFVGYNGAGKTTLTKLIMRLYDVSDGEITLDEIPIKSYGLEDYRSAYGAVFQDYQIFASSIKENVKMDLVSDNDNENIINALYESGFSDKLNDLANGIDTQLTREFNEKGVNLSGGEAQKIAIARVFAKPCSIILLDEPSSALDPISEYNLNKAMMEAAKNKTVIFISHRLSTTRMADRIYMLENGEIIEAGSHDELMSLNGKYAEMFNMQAEKYRIFT